MPMFSSLELATGGSPTASGANRSLIGSGSRRSRWWPVQMLASRRAICRLPLLALWTIIMMCILYKCLSGSKESLELNREDARPQLELAKEELIHRRSSPHYDRQQQQATQSIEASESYTTKPRLTASEVIKTTKRVSKNKPTIQTTTSKSANGQYARLSKVFILIIQDESYKFRYNYKKNVKFGSGQQVDIDNHLVVSPHIRLLIDILVAHKIDYSIDTTKSGLPTRLLTDQNDSGHKQYSVIIIDDFIKYTKLSRWNRDQLDRYCRSNQIGVITYLNSESVISDQDQTTTSSSSSSSSTSSSTPIRSQRDAEESTYANEFPLKFKLFDQRKGCKSNANSTPSCLTDHQLNDRSPILRVLKRKRDFVLAGKLEDNLNASPWVSMSSNHITYEPLTWARVSGVDDTIDHHLRFRRRATAAASTANTPDIRATKVTGVRSSPPSTVTQMGDQVDRFVYAKPTSASSRVFNSTSGMQNVIVDSGNWTTSAKPTAAPTTTTMDSYSVDTMITSNASPTNRQIEIGVTNTGEFLLEEGKNVASDFRGESPNAVMAAAIEPIGSSGNGREILSIFDRGLYDGIRRVIFGGANHIWLNRILLLDSIEHLSSGLILTPLTRYLQIDVDDIFVGERGKRMNRSDVDFLLETQDKFSQLVDGGFQFNLGFSGKYFKHGNGQENEGDEYLVTRASEFQWFCHFWSHAKAHLFDASEAIALELRKNLEFAHEKRLPLAGHGGQLSYLNEYLATNGSAKLPPTYAVAPHHSGVYPIHEQLYEQWSTILNVQVTSTEEYPHLRPASGRRGFVHKTIKVLPRQTCGLYTHTIWRHKYPGGMDKLEASIRGGELFESILHNQVNIYMTHMTNYANDRLAPYTFAELIDFVQNYTNLHLKFAASSEDSTSDGDNNNNNNNHLQLGPAKLADYYFSLHPNEREPLWTNPCDDKRHLAIWSDWKRQTLCPLTPKLLIVGPQKTGTTAFYSFLKLNPQFRSLPDDHSAPDFEEIQFFNDKYYYQGSDWYFRRFTDGNASASDGTLASPGGVRSSPPTSSPTAAAAAATAQDLEDVAAPTSAAAYSDDYSDRERSYHIYFDKSATYFDDPKVPRRAFALLPEARIIILLIDPADRAYSWYQHARAHNDSVANSMTFEQILNANDNLEAQSATSDPDLSRKVRGLRSRCLQPGFFAQHLMSWLNHYPSKQIVIIDGEWFRYNPAAVMTKLQMLLHLETQINYNEHLIYDERKGFYCQLEESSNQLDILNNRKVKKCLGSGKGRKYEPMSEEARIYLNRYFWQSNKQLAHILSEIGQPLPQWLDVLMTANSSPSDLTTSRKRRRRRRN